MSNSWEFDIAISFAGEQREQARGLALILRSTGVRVFFDEFKADELWGRDLAEYLKEVYYRKARFCLVFVSAAYATKIWPTFERRNVLARAIGQKSEYLLPVQFDQTDLPGLPPSTGYIKWSTAEEVAKLTVAKVLNVSESVFEARNFAMPASIDTSLAGLVSNTTRYPAYNIVVLGREGVGKSSLLNHLLGKKICEVGVGTSVTPIGFHKKEALLGGIPVYIYDSGGLGISSSGHWRQFLNAELASRDSSKPAEQWIHTVLYCVGAGSARVDKFELEVLKELLALEHRAILVLTKADQANVDELDTLRDTIRIEIGSQLPCVYLSTQTRTFPNGVQVQPFGLDDLKSRVIAGFWDSIRRRLPTRCIALLHQAVEQWANEQRDFIREEVGYINKNYKLFELKVRIEKFKFLMESRLVTELILGEVKQTIAMYNSIAILFGLRLDLDQAGIGLQFENLLGEAEDGLLSGIGEIAFDIIYFPFSLVLMAFRGSFNRMELEGFLQKVVDEMKVQIAAKREQITGLIDRCTSPL